MIYRSLQHGDVRCVKNHQLVPLISSGLGHDEDVIFPMKMAITRLIVSDIEDLPIFRHRKSYVQWEMNFRILIYKYGATYKQYHIS